MNAAHSSGGNANAYWKTKVMTANPAELRLMLLEGAIRFAQHARDGLARKDYEACYIGCTRTQNILLELINALRPESDADLCKKLSSLYTYMYLQMVNASHQRDLAKAEEVIKLLQYERETWAMVIEQLSAADAAGRTLDATGQAAGSADAYPGQASNAQSLVGGIVSVQG